jgi:hypothetical protein
MTGEDRISAKANGYEILNNVQSISPTTAERVAACPREDE